MNYEYKNNGITLQCVVDIDEVDQYSPHSGHYTKFTHYYLESAEHNGQDILELLSEDVVEDILDEFERSQNVI